MSGNGNRSPDALTPQPLKKAQDIFTKSFVHSALVLNQGKRARTAKYLAITREGLYKLMKRLGLS